MGSFLRHKNGDWPIFPGYTSHIEGWGLYSEFLGLEMGILQDPYQRIGFYSGSLLRAARLVVDTGLHAFGWSSEGTRYFFLSKSPILAFGDFSTMTGTLSGYFLLIFSPSALLFSNGCSSLYCHFMVLGLAGFWLKSLWEVAQASVPM